jgi:signal transduction histidine kinase
MVRLSASFRTPLRRAPSITHLFLATFFAVALAVLAIAITAWRGALSAERQAMTIVTTLDRLQESNPSPALEAERGRIRDLASDLADDAAQDALATSIIVFAVLIALAMALWYSRRRLAEPFAAIATALTRVAAGDFSQRFPEEAEGEFGMIARGVNRMKESLALRERMQEHTARLLAALNAAPREGGALVPSLGVLAEDAGAEQVLLYQPVFEANEWQPTAVQGVSPSPPPISRITVRELLGDGSAGVQRASADGLGPIRQKLGLSVADGGEIVLAPLRAANKFVGLIVVLAAQPLSDDHRAVLELALPNLAIACERETAFQNQRRLAVELRRSAQYLEEQSDELTRLNEELAKANRLKSEFLANMSHELRTPLNSIIGFSEILLTENVGTLTAVQQDFVETVARNGRHLLQLISELLDLSKIEAGHLTLQPESLELGSVLREAVESVRAQVEKRRHDLTLETTPQQLTVSGDRVRVRQIVLNLLSNAIKFTPDGGRIQVRARVENGAVHIAVTDSGIGIAPEDQGKLFKEFVQLDASASRQYEGTGLGLALCKRLVELHGGAMGLESAPGRGSTFWFTLPNAGGA